MSNFSIFQLEREKKLAREWWLLGNRKKLKFQHLLMVWLWASHLTSPGKFSYLRIGNEDSSSVFFTSTGGAELYLWNIMNYKMLLKCLVTPASVFSLNSCFCGNVFWPSRKPGMLSCCPVWLSADDYSPVLVRSTSGHLISKLRIA